MMMAVCPKPRCYVLDEGYRLVLAPPTSPDDPLNHLYEATSAADALPGRVDCVVRALTRGWEHESEPAERSALINGIRVTVAPLHGLAGRHFAVFVDSEALAQRQAAHPERVSNVSP